MGQIVKVYKDGVGYQVLNTNNIGDALEAGDNISINGNEISAVDTTYSAGTGLSLSGTTFSLNINYGADLSLSIDPSTFVLTAQLKDQNGSNIGSAQTIDLPLESVVVSGTYNAQTKEVELTLQSGSVIRFSVADLVSGLQEELVVGDGINIDANNEISVDTSVIATKEYVDDSIAEFVSSGPTAPSNPTQGMLRYDTVNNVLKSYDGSNWNEVGNESADINTKTFHLSGTSDLTNAQAAYDWFSAGKNPIVMYNNRAYLLYAKNATQLIFQDIENSAYNQNSYTEYVGQKIIFTLSGNDVTAINYNSTSGWSGPILRTDVDYSTPYTPTYAGSPATKQYVDNNDTYIGASAPIDNVVEGRLWYDTTNSVLKEYDGTNWNEVNTDTTYTAGTGISIDANNVISNTQTSAEWGNITGTLSDQTDLQNALDEKQDTLTAGNHIDITNNTISTIGLQESLTAGDNITIGDICTTESDMKGPCPKGFHIPTGTEWDYLATVSNSFGINTRQTVSRYFKMPLCGNLNFSTGAHERGGTDVQLWASNASTWSSIVTTLYLWSGATIWTTTTGYGFCIRPMKNSPVVPDSTWTVLYDGSSVAVGAGIFHSPTEELISYSNDGTTWQTIADKNLGATVAYTYGDTMSESNCGKFYQRGNNHGFPYTGATTTSSVQTDTSGYGPGNYYSSDVFITASTRISPWNGDLRGGVTQGTFQDCIHNVISAIDTTYTAGTGISIDANNVISATATPGQTYTAGNGIDIDANNEISVDTTVVATQTDLSGKQDTLTAGTNIQINGSTISATDTTYTAGTGISIDANNVISNTQTSAEWGNITGTLSNQTDLQNALDEKQDTLTAGNHIDITNNVISAEGFQEELTAGENITIGEVCESDMQGPCPSGFHVPTVGEWNGLINIMKNALSLQYGHQWMQYLHMPYAGQRDCESSNVDRQRIEGFYATSIFDDATPSFSMAFFLLVRAGDTVYVEEYGLPVTIGFSVRGFKNEYITPTSSWTVVQGTLGSAGIFRDQTNGLISITDGTTGYTIMDKNLGATTVYNSGDTLSEANCGKYYQWGNNYGFPRSGSITTSSTQVDASGYGPGNYYSSSTFITTSTSPFDWSSVENKNLRGGVSQGTWCRLTISAEDTKYTAGTGINIDANNVISSTVTPGQTYTAGNGINISQNNEISADTSVVATKTDVSNKVSKGVNNVSNSSTTLFSIVDNTDNYSATFGSANIGIHSQNDLWWGTLNPGNVNVGGQSQGNTLYTVVGYDHIVINDTTNNIDTTYALDKINYHDGFEIISENYEFSGGGNNQIARLKDVKTYTAGAGINIDANNEISNTLPGPTISATAPTGTEGALWYDTTNDVLMAHDGTTWKEAGTQMKVLSYGHSTWQDFINAYNENAIVYCKASSNSNPGSGVQGRMAFMAFVSINSGTGLPTSVEFQYYRSRSDHNTQANQLDEVYVYKLESNGTWTVTQRNTGAKAVAGAGINLAFGGGNMTISADTTTLATQTDLSGKQATLVSGTNIKTINNESLLGSGNITISPGETPNVKVFTISGVGDTTTGQQIYDYYEAGKTPLLKYNDVIYKLTDFSTNGTDFDIKFEGAYAFDESSSYSHIDGYTIIIFGANDVVSDVVPASFSLNYLATDSNYTTPYTPQYNGSPATKKYVDDKAVGLSSETGNVLTAGAKIWTGDETDMPASPNSNTLYFCY